MMNKHTPGPWAIGNPTEVHSDAGTRIVMCCQTAEDADDDVSEANARLIAAAPELLEIAESILADDMLQFLPAEYVAKVRAAIAKATGQ